MKLKRMFRAASTDSVVVDKESRTIEFSFSSEYPVERWFGKEILSHKSDAADLTRLNDGGAFLWNHRSDQVIGVVESAEIRADKKGYVKARFSKSADGERFLQDVEDKIIRNVSFGYMVKEMSLMNPGAKGEDQEYLATRWEPFEVSLVSVPADPTVGVGRAGMDEELEVRVLNEEPKTKPIKGETKMDEKEKAALEAKIRGEAQESERARMLAIGALGEKFKLPELERQLKESGASIEDARTAFLEKIGMVQKPITGSEGEIGLNEKEKRSFSFVRAISALANPHDQRAQEAAKFERECSAAAEKVGGKTSRGIMVPTDVLRGSKRDLTAGSASGGGYTVATELMSGSFIELLRNKMVVQRLGAQVMNGMQGNFALPKMTGGATSYWVAENVAPTEGAETFGQVAFSPKTIAGYVDASRRLLIQSSSDIENIIKNDLAASIGLGIDSKAFYGDGASNTITGVRYATDLNTVDFSGSNPTYAEIVDMESQVAADNADVGSLAYAMNALARGVLKTTLVTATYGDRMIWEPGNTVNGYRTEVSNQVSKLSTADYDYFFGNWNDLILAFWSGLDLLVDPYTGSKEGTVRVTAFQDVDCGVRHGESFCYGNKTIS